MTGRQRISSGSPYEREIGYSRAVIDGDWTFVSGTTGFDYVTMTISWPHHDGGDPVSHGVNVLPK